MIFATNFPARRLPGMKPADLQPNSCLAFEHCGRELFYLRIVTNRKENEMKKLMTIPLLVIGLALSACTPLAARTSVPLPDVEPVVIMETQSPDALSPASPNQYTNDQFGLAFEYPSNWFGPSEYVSDGTLRVEIGSDTVYPYGERPEQASDVKNSYNVVIQYAKNVQNSYWMDTYQSLLTMKDGESLSTARSLLIRVRQLQIGRFTGFEYITTLPETAATEHVYIRSIMVFDENTNDLLTVMAQPMNVEIPSGAAWRDVFQSIDEANLIYFQEILASMEIQ